jgi:hypothetical protein
MAGGGGGVSEGSGSSLIAADYELRWVVVWRIWSRRQGEEE